MPACGMQDIRPSKMQRVMASGGGTGSNGLKSGRHSSHFYIFLRRVACKTSWQWTCRWRCWGLYSNGSRHPVPSAMTLG